VPASREIDVTSLLVTKQAGECTRPGGRWIITDYHKIEAFCSIRQYV